MIAYRFHSIEADGPWASPPFPPAERRHIVQGVIGGHLFGHPRWATDLDGNFIYGLDARGKEMFSAPAYAPKPTPRRRGKNKPKTAAQERKRALSERMDTALLTTLRNRRADPYGVERGAPWENPKTPAELDRDIAEVLARRKP